LWNSVLVITSQVDPLLLPFLTAGDAVEEATVLARLNAEQVEPTVRRILGYRLQSYLSRSDLNQSCPDVEEVYHDVQLRLLKRLRALKQDPTEKPIANLHSYVATIARNTCDEYLRRKYPLRRSLKDKIRHYLTNHSEFTLWEDKEYGWLTGLAGWESRYRAGAELTAPMGGELYELLQKDLQSVDVQRLELHELVATIFKVALAPLELDHLTELVAILWGVEDQAVQSFDANEYGSVDQRVDAPADQETLAEHRELLQVLWGEICELPRRHRVALLLNLRSPRGVNVILLLPATGVATFEQIAQALEIPLDEFEQMWADLPLDDLRIAAYLGASRQQVINLRKTARDRLLRSLRLQRGE
jgi:RNA polymerase sigma factor (sigma-70 family)